MSGIGTILQANNMHRIAKAQWEQRTQEQKAGNKLAKAQGDLANWSRSLSNRRRVTAAEEQFNAAAEALSNEAKAAGKQKANMTLDYAEQSGNLLALAAFSGVGGASVEAMENLIALQDATSQEELDQTVSRMLYNGKKSAASSLASEYKAQDFSQTVVQFDNTRHIAPKAMGGRLLKLAAVAVATYFGGPMAGEAVANLAVGDWKASNGDFAGANQSFGAAISGGLSAAKGYSDRGNTAWGSDVMQGFRKPAVETTGSVGNRKVASASTKNKSWFG